MGLALGALAGVLSGLQGLPQGMQAGTQADQHQQQIDLMKQQLAQQQEANYADVAGPMLPSGVQGQVDPTKGTARVRTSLVAPYLSAQQHEQARTQEMQDRQGKADAFQKLAESTGNQNFAALANLMRSGGVKDAGSIFEAELKGQQGVAERNSGLDVLRSMGINVPEIPSRGAPTTAAAPAGLADAQRGVASAAEGVRQATDAYNATPGSVPGLITPPGGGGAGGGPTPMPNNMSAFKPDISFKAGPATINLKTPTDTRDSYASSLFNGRLFHQLNPAEQTKVLEALPDSPGNRLAQAKGQGENAAQIALDKGRVTPLTPTQASELGVPYGTTQEGAYGKTPLTAQQQNKEGAAKSALAIINGVEQELKGVSLPSGPGGRLAQTPQNLWGVYAQGDPKLAALNARIQGTLSTVIRALGEVGTLSDKDIARANSLWPKFVPVPDTKEVVAEKMRGLRELVQEVGGRQGTTGAPAAPTTGAPPRRRFNPATGLLE